MPDGGLEWPTIELPASGEAQTQLHSQLAGMPKREKLYDQVISDALEHVHIFALRRGIEAGVFTAAFDLDRGPGPHSEHTLTLTVRASGIVVTGHGIPHDWLSVGTSFIDVRYSKRIADLLQELENKAQIAGKPI